MGGRLLASELYPRWLACGLPAAHVAGDRVITKTSGNLARKPCVRGSEEFMLTDEQVALLCDIGRSIAFDDDKNGEVDRLIVDGYVLKDGDLYDLTAKGLKIVEDRAGPAIAELES